MAAKRKKAPKSSLLATATGQTESSGKPVELKPVPTTFDRQMFLAKLWEMEARLVAAGFPEMSPWWKGQLANFVLCGKLRGIFRVGRRGGKSTTFCRFMVAWALYGKECGGWNIPPGDRPVVSVVSIDNSEASGRLYTMHHILETLKVQHQYHNVQSKHEIRIVQPEVFIWVVTCSIRGTVGHTSILIYGDEMSKWRNERASANPAEEVMESLRPSMATVPNGFEICTSAPWVDGDYHSEMFDEGDTQHQMVAYAPTWVANPTLTEEQTHALEPDLRKWRRAYAAIPAGGGSDNWFGGAQERAFTIEAWPDPYPNTVPTFAIHPDIKDQIGWAVVTSEIEEDDPDRRMTRVRASGVIETMALSPTQIVHKLLDVMCYPWLPKPDVGQGSYHILSTAHEGDTFSAACMSAGVMLEVVNWGSGDRDGVWQTDGASRLARVKAVRAALKQGTVQYREPRLKRLLGRVQSAKTAGEREKLDFGKQSTVHELFAVILSISAALERPAALPPALTEQSEMKLLKQKLARDADRKFRQKWQRDKYATMREVIFR